MIQLEVETLGLLELRVLDFIVDFSRSIGHRCLGDQDSSTKKFVGSNIFMILHL